MDRTAQSFGVALESVDRSAMAPSISARLRALERSYSSAFTASALDENEVERQSACCKTEIGQVKERRVLLTEF